jgi:hypothetical protein
MTDATSTASPRKLGLLVVDDEVLVAGMIADQLAEFGYTVAGPACTLKDGQLLASGAPIDAGPCLTSTSASTTLPVRSPTS